MQDIKKVLEATDILLTQPPQFSLHQVSKFRKGKWVDDPTVCISNVVPKQRVSKTPLYHEKLDTAWIFREHPEGNTAYQIFS